VAVPESVIWQNDRYLLPPRIATLQEPFGNAVFATGEQELTGRSVGIFGCGPIGLFSIAIARAAGAAGVWAADRTPFRLGLATRMGATATVDVSSVDDTAAWFRDQNEGYGLDVVFEMSGSSQAINNAFQVVRNGGRVVLFGIPSRPVEIDVAEALIFKNLSVLALNGRKVFDTWYKTRWMLERGVVDLSPLVTDEIEGLDGVNDALARLQAGEACKIVVYPNGRPEPPTQPRKRKATAGERRRQREPNWAHR
jgi:threonine 3-dehydrogenase